MKNKINNILLSFFSCITLISVGFASWSITNGEIFVTDSLIAHSEDTIYKNILTCTSVETFAINDEGMVKDDVVVNDCNIKFNFQLLNNYINTETIRYNMKLTFKNIKSSMDMYCRNDFININNTIVINKQTPFPQYNSSQNNQIYTEIITINKDINNNVTNFSISFNFTGNFYSIVLNDLILNIDLISI